MSTGLALAIFLPTAPLAAFVVHLWDKRRAERRAAQRFADDVETWTVIRHRG